MARLSPRSNDPGRPTPETVAALADRATTRCSRMAVKISSLIDHELKSERDARRVHAHVKICPRCAATYRELRSARLSARSLRQQDLPSDFWHDVSSRLDEVDQSGILPPEPSQPLRWTVRYATRLRHAILLLALATVLVLVLHVLLPPQPADQGLFPGASSSIGPGRPLRPLRRGAPGSSTLPKHSTLLERSTLLEHHIAQPEGARPPAAHPTEPGKSASGPRVRDVRQTREQP